MARLTEDQLKRFLTLAADHGNPAEALVAFSRYANSWEENHAILRCPIVRLRILAGQKNQAISDAQCMWLASRQEGKKEVMDELGKLLESLGAKPIDPLPTPAEVLIFPPGVFIDLFHDPTIQPIFAAEVARKIAAFWNCEVHVTPCQLDATKLSSYNTLNKSISAQEFARGIVRITARPGMRLHTIFLTDHKLRVISSQC